MGPRGATIKGAGRNDLDASESPRNWKIEQLCLDFWRNPALSSSAHLIKKLTWISLSF